MNTFRVIFDLVLLSFSQNKADDDRQNDRYRQLEDHFKGRQGQRRKKVSLLAEKKPPTDADVFFLEEIECENKKVKPDVGVGAARVEVAACRQKFSSS